MSARVVVLLLCAFALAADEPTPKAQLAGMKWLAGTWRGKIWGGEFTAYYSTPDGGKILGYSELVKKGKLDLYEFEKFEVRGGAIVYSPYPRGRPATQLKLTGRKPFSVVFENPKKDYPTRITFAFLNRVGNDYLVITLSDPHNKSEKRDVFELERVR